MLHTIPVPKQSSSSSASLSDEKYELKHSQLKNYVRDSGLPPDSRKYVIYDFEDDSLAEFTKLEKDPLEKAAKGPLLSSGNPKAQFILAQRAHWLYKQNSHDNTIKWATKAAEQGYFPAFLLLINTNTTWYKWWKKLNKLAKDGNLEAEFYLGV